jgi:hypothetical protein
MWQVKGGPAVALYPGKAIVSVGHHNIALAIWQVDVTLCQ